LTRRELLPFWSVGLALASEIQNLSYPLRTLEGTITPPSAFFVRDHFSPPEVSLATWTLRIEGSVERQLDVSFSDLVEMPSRKVRAVLECAGNAVGGSAVSCGQWEGVPISTLLELARPAGAAAFVMLEGADSGRLFPDAPVRPYSQVVPLAKCNEPESLIAFKLNDLTLPKRNGFPARALFPSWYGMDSVKWLKRIVVLRSIDEAITFRESGMDRLYNRVRRVGERVQAVRLSEVQVKSVVAWPNDGMKLPVGRYSVWGFAWSAKQPVRTVQISLDGGKGWNNTRFENSPQQFGWVRWRYDWSARPGDYVLMSRASDEGGSEQPLTRDPARQDGYELNWCKPLRCSVR
jgi:DMSO/TMAO reductase YedYZ molybdopterin-dependent catalytic subunit